MVDVAFAKILTIYAVGTKEATDRGFQFSSTDVMGSMDSDRPADITGPFDSLYIVDAFVTLGTVGVVDITGAVDGADSMNAISTVDLTNKVGCHVGIRLSMNGAAIRCCQNDV